jgi:hypothetical protein
VHEIVLIEQLTMRLVARRLLPSVNREMICVRFSMVSLFILDIMPERSCIGKVDNIIKR